MSKKSHKALASATVMSLILTSTLTATVSAATGVERLSGSNRETTAIDVATKVFEKAETVVLVNGYKSADALSATPLAKAYNAPILSVGAVDEPTAALLASLKDLGAKKVVVVGGEGAVTKALAAKLAETYTVERIEGKDRYATNVNVAKKVMELKASKEAFVVNGSDASYADALSIASIAASKGAPIVFTNGKTVSEDAKALVKDLKVAAIGGTGVVSADVLAAVNATRVGGADRFETNLEVLKAYKDVIKLDNVFVAYGLNFADALVASAAAAKTDAPVVLADKTNTKFTKGATDYIEANKAAIKNVYLVGGTGVIADSVKNTIDGIVNPVATNLVVESVSANNLKEIVVKFNKEVDKDELDKADFSISPSVTFDDPELLEDGKTVILYVTDGATVLTNQTKEYSLTIKDVKDTNGKAIEKTTIKFKPVDATLPVVENIQITGPKSFKVKFNEPIDKAVLGSVKVKSATTTLSVKTLTAANFNKNELEVELYTSLKDGTDYTIEVSNFKDYAGYTNTLKSHEFKYVADTTPPTASLDKSTQEYVVVKFNKPVKGLEKTNFYHTFTAWTAKGIYKTKADMDAGINVITASDWVDTVYVKFADGNKSGDYPLQPGAVKVNVKGKVDSTEVKDKWDNKLGDVVLTANISADVSAPQVTNVEVKAKDELKVTFDEAIKSAKTSNFEILDGEGKTISGLSFTTELSSDKKAVTLKFNKDMTGKTIKLNVKDIVDNTINENKLSLYTKTLEFTDSEFKGVDRVEYNSSEKVLYVVFKEEVSDTGINIKNYRLRASNGKEYELDGPASFYTSNKVVKIELTNTEAGYAASAGAQLLVANVKDVAGNEAFLQAAPINTTGVAATVEKVKAISKNKVAVQFDQELETVEASEFQLKIGAAIFKNATGVETEINEDGTLVTLSFEDDIPADPTGVQLQATFVNTKNQFAVKPVNIAARGVDDYIAPSIAKVSDVEQIKTVDSNNDGKIDKITMEFDEKLNPAFVSALTWEVEGRVVETATLDTSATGKLVTLNLKVNSDVIANTSVKPTVTQKLDVKDLGLNGVLTAKAFNDEKYETSDTSAPILLSAVGAVGSDAITLTFSEAVFGGTKSNTINIAKSDFTFTDGVAGGKAIDSITSTEKKDVNTIVIKLNAPLTADDFETATISKIVANSTIIDVDGNQANTTAVNLTK